MVFVFKLESSVCIKNSSLLRNQLIKMKKITNIRLLTTMLMAGVILPSFVGAQIGVVVDVNSTTINSTSNSTMTTGGTSIQPMSVESSAQVRTSDDLVVFGAALAGRGENVNAVKFESDGETGSQVIVSYNHPGKFLGFIPVTLRSKTVVTTNANSEVAVSSRLPWWAFLVAKANFAKAELESQIESNQVVTANAKAGASANARAMIAEAVIAEIEAQAAAAARVEN